MEEALTFGIQFLGAPYVYWKDGMTLGEGPPAWSTDGPPPDKREVFREGLFCCGLVNLMLRHIGKSPPKNPPYDGGTVSYHLRYASQWIPFELHKVQRGVFVEGNEIDVDQGTQYLEHLRMKRTKGTLGLH
eukprot:TRINITY_DN22073_c0_g1_i2.p1 TRINITY_DN22073_c0_g1~~TRINITY_DN22073_c0_g1_i2.p1  ORF type:complete len:131 (-),score=19.76 TRINITY_DN22073_c0_g1_i2:169-561(-)